MISEYEKPKEESHIIHCEVNQSRCGFDVGQKAICIKKSQLIVITIERIHRIDCHGYPEEFILEGVDCHGHMHHAHSDNCILYKKGTAILNAQNNIKMEMF